MEEIRLRVLEGGGREILLLRGTRSRDQSRDLWKAGRQRSAGSVTMGSSTLTLVGLEGDWLHGLQTWKISLCLRGRRGSGPEGTVCIWTVGVSGYPYKQITDSFRLGRLPSSMSLHKIPGS